MITWILIKESGRKGPASVNRRTLKFQWK